MCLGLLGTLAATALHIDVSHPEILDRLASSEASVELTGIVDSRVESRHTPWGEVSCRADVRLAGSESLDVRQDTEGGDRAASEGVSWKAVVVDVYGVPCDALEGQQIAASGKLTANEASDRAAVRVFAANSESTGAGHRAARVVRDIDEHLTGLLATRPEHARGLIPGVALGDDTRVSSELDAAMKLTQLTHLIAVSGGHVSILTVLVLIVVGKRFRVLSAFLCLLVLGGLVLLVGPHASVLRAVAMGTVVLAALGWGRTTQAIASLSLAIVAVALIDPWLVTSYGFLLSASATAGIVILGTPLAEHLTHAIPSLLAQAMAIPLAAQLSCLPILMLFSDAGSIWGVCANAVVAPVVAPLTVTGLAAALLSPLVPGVASLLLIPAQMGTWWIDLVARSLARWPGSGISLQWTAVACIVLVLVLLCVDRPGQALLLLLLVAACLWWTSRPSVSSSIRSDWAVVQCDVGQGSALLARGADTTIMIDVGPPGDAAAQCLKQAEVDHLDVLVLSHAHTDHIGGLPEVLDAAAVDRVWLSPNPDPVANTEWMHSQLRSRGVPWARVLAGQSLNQDGTVSHAYPAEGGAEKPELARVIWPRSESARPGEANAQSLALYLDIAGGVLVLSDLTAQSQDRVAGDSSLADALAEVGIVVVAHHGSADQSSRLAGMVNPRLALVSVGENSYGHPSDRALELYGESLILDTMTCGTISIGADGEANSRCGNGDMTTAN